MKKLGVSVGLIFCLCCVDVNAQESMRFDNEGKKLQFIRQMLLKEKNLRIADDTLYTYLPYCSVMMKDLLEDKNFRAIEPDVRADSVDDHKIAKWRKCDGADYHDFNIDAKKLFWGLPQLGAPPYRYYWIELDGNKENGPEDMIYAESSDELSYAETAYTWVNLKKCEIKTRYYVTGSKSNWSPQPNAIYLNLLVYYQRKPWVIDFVDGFHFELMSMDPKGMETCRWRLFKPE